MHERQLYTTESMNPILAFTHTGITFCAFSPSGGKRYRINPQGRRAMDFHVYISVTQSTRPREKGISYHFVTRNI